MTVSSPTPRRRAQELAGHAHGPLHHRRRQRSRSTVGGGAGAPALRRLREQRLDARPRRSPTVPTPSPRAQTDAQQRRPAAPVRSRSRSTPSAPDGHDHRADRRRGARRRRRRRSRARARPATAPSASPSPAPASRRSTAAVLERHVRRPRRARRCRPARTPPPRRRPTRPATPARAQRRRSRSTRPRRSPRTTRASIGNAWKTTAQTVTLTPDRRRRRGVAHTYFTTDGSTPTTASAEGTSITPGRRRRLHDQVLLGRHARQRRSGQDRRRRRSASTLTAPTGVTTFPVERRRRTTPPPGPPGAAPPTASAARPPTRPRASRRCGCGCSARATPATGAARPGSPRSSNVTPTGTTSWYVPMATSQPHQRRHVHADGDRHRRRRQRDERRRRRSPTTPPHRRPTSTTSTNRNGAVAAGDTVSVTFGEALNPATVPSTGTLTLTRGRTGQHHLGRQRADQRRLSTGNTGYLRQPPTGRRYTVTYAGTIALSNANRTVTFTVTGALRRLVHPAEHDGGVRHVVVHAGDDAAGPGRQRGHGHPHHHERLVLTVMSRGTRRPAGGRLPLLVASGLAVLALVGCGGSGSDGVAPARARPAGSGARDRPHRLRRRRPAALGGAAGVGRARARADGPPAWVRLDATGVPAYVSLPPAALGIGPPSVHALRPLPRARARAPGRPWASRPSRTARDEHHADLFVDRTYGPVPRRPLLGRHRDVARPLRRRHLAPGDDGRRLRLGHLHAALDARRRRHAGDPLDRAAARHRSTASGSATRHPHKTNVTDWTDVTLRLS